MDNTQVVILAIASFIAGFTTCKAFFATLNEYLIYRNGCIYKVGETLPNAPEYPNFVFIQEGKAKISNPAGYHPLPIHMMPPPYMGSKK